MFGVIHVVSVPVTFVFSCIMKPLEKWLNHALSYFRQDPSLF